MSKNIKEKLSDEAFLSFIQTKIQRAQAKILAETGLDSILVNASFDSSNTDAAVILMWLSESVLNGKNLEEFIDEYSPLTLVDFQLLLAYVFDSKLSSLVLHQTLVSELLVDEEIEVFWDDNYDIFRRYLKEHEQIIDDEEGKSWVAKKDVAQFISVDAIEGKKLRAQLRWVEKIAKRLNLKGKLGKDIMIQEYPLLGYDSLNLFFDLNTVYLILKEIDFRILVLPVIENFQIPSFEEAQQIFNNEVVITPFETRQYVSKEQIIQFLKRILLLRLSSFAEHFFDRSVDVCEQDNVFIFTKRGFEIGIRDVNNSKQFFELNDVLTIFTRLFPKRKIS